MRPLSYFIDTDFSRAMAEEYGECLSTLKEELTWVKFLVDNLPDDSFVTACRHNINYTSHTQGQRALFKLALDLYEQENSLARFREILAEYS